MDLQKLIRALTSGELDFKSPMSEDISQQFGRLIPEIMLAFMIGNSDKLLKGALDSTPTTGAPDTLTDTNPTAGSIDRDDQFNGAFVHFTSGTIYTNNNFNRYEILDTLAGPSQLVVDGDLEADGAALGDTYEILGHTHSGTDGSKIDLKNLVNASSGNAMDQDIADAITDPDGERLGTADRTEPFITKSDGLAAGMIFIWNDSNSCPAGTTRVAEFDEKFLRGNTTKGGTGGTSTHTHTSSGTGTGVEISDDGLGNNLDSTNHLPPYYDVLFCKKD